MANFESIIKEVKTTEKGSDEHLRQNLFALNRYIFRRLKMPVTKKSADMVINDLKAFVKAFEGLKFEQKYGGEGKRDEIVKILKSYIGELTFVDVTATTDEEIQRALKYRLFEWLNEKKKKVISPDKLLDLAKMNKWVYDAYLADLKIQNPQYNSMQREIYDTLWGLLKFA